MSGALLPLFVEIDRQNRKKSRSNKNINLEDELFSMKCASFMLFISAVILFITVCVSK